MSLGYKSIQRNPFYILKKVVCDLQYYKKKPTVEIPFRKLFHKTHMQCRLKHTV